MEFSSSVTAMSRSLRLSEERSRVISNVAEWAKSPAVSGEWRGVVDSARDIAHAERGSPRALAYLTALRHVMSAGSAASPRSGRGHRDLPPRRAQWRLGPAPATVPARI